MNNQSPLIPQGSLLEQKSKSRARVRLAVFFVISILVVGLMGLLMQGCRKPQETETPPEVTTAPPPPLEVTNPPVVDTNPPAASVAPPVVETPPPALAPAPATQEYTVVQGDNFYTIAKKFPGVTVKRLLEANPNVQPTRLHIGQKLQIPPAAAPSATAPSSTAPGTSPDGQLIYKVKSGDNLTKIATEHGTTVKALRALNNLTTDTIKVGQPLKIPAKAPAPAPVENAPAPTVPAAPGGATPGAPPSGN